MKKGVKTHLILAVFLNFLFCGGIFAWSWNTADNVLPSLREDLDQEIAAYRQQVGTGLSLHDRILVLDRLVGNFKPLGLNVVELETERSRLMLQAKQQQLRSAEAQDEATLLYERGVKEYRAGLYRQSLDTFYMAERKLPGDTAIRDLRGRLEMLVPIIEDETAPGLGGEIIRLAVIRYLENDPKRAINAVIYAKEKKVDRPELVRFHRLIEKTHPEVESPNLSRGISLVDYKLQSSLVAIYDGRYLSAIAECSDVLDLEPENVMALTRLGSAYYAMNEKTRAKKIWTKALQLDKNNKVLKKFLYGSKGASRVEANR